MERWVERKTVYAGRIFDVVAGTVQLDDGHRAFRDVIEHRGAVGVVPYTGTGVVLVRQYRIGAESEMLEIPAGKLEKDDKSPEARGRLELEEETGHIAATWRGAGKFYPSPAILTEQLHLFIATDLSRTTQRLDVDERIEVIEMPLAEVRKALGEHRFEDAKTIIGLWALLAHVQG